MIAIGNILIVSSDAISGTSNAGSPEKTSFSPHHKQNNLSSRNDLRQIKPIRAVTSLPSLPLW